MIRLVVGRGRYVRQMKVPFWMIAAAGGALLLLGFLLMAFLASLALLAIPAILIGAGAAHFLGRGRPSFHEERSFPRDQDPNVIEGEYRVLDERRR
jgi:hypothetical protein